MVPDDTNPMVVIKLVVKEPSEKRKSKQLLPTPAEISSECQVTRKNIKYNPFPHFQELEVLCSSI